MLRIGLDMPRLPITIIAYGSLMSGLGLGREQSLPVSDAWRVRLRNARRGFGKLSQYGDRYAMILEPLRADAPIRAERIERSSRNSTAPEAIAFTLDAEAFARVARREGYRADALLQHAAASEQDVAQYLWDLSARSGNDLECYRRALFEAIGYTSPHYIPHPVMMGMEPAIMFLAPGVEGSGSDAVIPIRVSAGMTQCLSLTDAWQRKPNDSQLEYFAMCLLAEEHGVSLADVDDRHDGGPALIERLRARLEAERRDERTRFRAALHLSEAAYAKGFTQIA